MPMLHSQSSDKDLLLEIQETFFYYLFSEERVALYLLFHSPPHKPWGTANVQSQGHLLGRVLPSGRARFLLRRGLQERKSSLPPLLACSPHSCTCQNDTCLLGRAGRPTPQAWGEEAGYLTWPRIQAQATILCWVRCAHEAVRVRTRVPAQLLDQNGTLIPILLLFFGRQTLQPLNTNL